MCSTCSNAPDPTRNLTGAPMAVSAALRRRRRPSRCAGPSWKHHILSTRSEAHVNGARIGRSDRSALRQIEGTRPRSAGPLLSRAKCRPTTLGRNRDGASGGNCTYVSTDGGLLIRDACEECCLGLSETCREDLAFRKLVAVWPVLSPAANEKIMELASSAG
jgi:hypothetical protein